ncbi:hypothetical protein [Comamonas squillarum]|uniref:Uncharacterized protein n=1 Tax=Comamonas squillarum TaxID=2977320 RepID=A0ABY6A2V6_9BURK|nr:hypothetical protein [Comamonas sp. PR12]UXC20518.1 hypothetical protein N4T19_10600 [Comamonas sp. PR12]
MKRNPANIAAANDFSQGFGQHEFVSVCKLKPEQIALALLAGHVATQQQSIAQIGAMLREVLDAIATVDDRVDMVADRTWKSRYLILDAINKAKSQPQKRNRSLAKMASAIKRPRKLQA